MTVIPWHGHGHGTGTGGRAPARGGGGGGCARPPAERIDQALVGGLATARPVIRPMTRPVIRPVIRPVTRAPGPRPSRRPGVDAWRVPFVRRQPHAASTRIARAPGSIRGRQPEPAHRPLGTADAAEAADLGRQRRGPHEPDAAQRPKRPSDRGERPAIPRRRGGRGRAATRSTRPVSGGPTPNAVGAGRSARPGRADPAARPGSGGWEAVVHAPDPRLRRGGRLLSGWKEPSTGASSKQLPLRLVEGVVLAASDAPRQGSRACRAVSIGRTRRGRRERSSAARRAPGRACASPGSFGAGRRG